MRRLVLVALALLTTGILPGAARGSAGVFDDEIPDVWSGSWPAQLMPGAVHLGTLNWRPMAYEEGRALVGLPYGGKEFAGCPVDGSTRFFRGRYVLGGTLVACTVGEDGRKLVGRFDGNEALRSGTFEITLLRTDPQPFFFGVYHEDHGISTDWCGVREKAFAGASTPVRRPPPSATAIASARRGAAVPLRFSVFGGEGAVRVTLAVTRAGKTLHRAALAGRPDGTIVVRPWRTAVRGAATLCVTATDALGRSARSCSRLRL